MCSCLELELKSHFTFLSIMDLVTDKGTIEGTFKWESNWRIK